MSVRDGHQRTILSNASRSDAPAFGVVLQRNCSISDQLQKAPCAQNLSTETSTCRLIRQLSRAPCTRGLTYECSNDGEMAWVTGGCGAELATSQSSMACHTTDPRRVYICHLRPRSLPGRLSELGRWAPSSLLGGQACDFFCRYRHEVRRTMTQLVERAKAHRWLASDARDYVLAVYRDPRVAAWPDERVLAHVRRLGHGGSWAYHQSASPLTLGCAHSFGHPRGSLCRRARTVRHGLVFCPPFKIRSLHWFGWFTAPSPVDACADPPLPSFHPDHAWIEVLRIATIAVSGSAAAVARFGEGGGHGCWFLALNGTGVFLHLGRSIRAQSRAALGAALGINLTKLTSTPGRPLWHSPWSEISRRCIRTCGSAMARGGEASIASSWWRSHAAPS